MHIPYTPAETIFHGTAGVWNGLRTTKLDQKTITRRRIIHDLIDSPYNRQQLYQALTSILNDDHRLFLYLPSTLIPHVNECYGHIMLQYITALLNSLQHTIEQMEPRAYITNGDELSNEPKFISPAAIVARILVQKGHLSPDWISTCAPYIQRSYKDTLQTVLPIEDQTDPKRDTWLKWEHQRCMIKPKHNQNPNLEGPLSPNLLAVADKIAVLQQLVTTDPQLKDLIYPVLIVYGSQLKGYGSPASDIDVAVITQPHTTPDKIKTIHNKIPDVIVYFLDDVGDRLVISDFEAVDDYKLIGAPCDVYPLFNGVWFGDTNAQKLLRDKLLRPIIEDPSPIRAILRRDIERHLLQYRLLHRGYETYYPTTGPTFLDDGYRLLATKLYLKYIILP